MNPPKIKEFIRDKKYLLWWIKEDEKENVSIDFLVESILNFGDEKDVKRLFDLIGIKRVAKIFYRQAIRKRVNYHNKTVNFFKLYFKRHVT